MQGKVHTVGQSTGPDLQFEYGPTGHRIEKRIKNGTPETRWDRYYYLRDPQGNVMAVYSFSYDDLGNDEYCRSMQLDELHVYGSSRIAVSKPQATLYKECFELSSPAFDSEGFLTGGTFLELPGGEDNTGSSYQYTITRGLKYYEVGNHLGNVMSTLRDRKLPQESSGDILNFTPDVSTWQDYLPFGMLMYYRNGDDGEVGRYGFQAQERDDELKGAGNSIDYKFRMHDPRLGRFFAVDPLAAQYPWNSPFAFSENRVIAAIELEGLEAVDLYTNKNVNEPFTSQSSMDALGSNNTLPWADLIKFKPSQNDVNSAAKRVWGTPKVQQIEDGNGRLNIDYYSVTISSLPKGVNSGEELLSHFRNSLNDFTNANTNFEAYNKEEGRLFAKNVNSALMSFEVLLFGSPFINPDDLSVMQSKNSTNYWVFSTVTTLRDGGHPVSGNRQFGVTTNSNGTYTFFTRGADRPNSLLDKVNSNMIFRGADNLWQAVMTNMVEFVNSNGGSAERNVTYSQQIEWKP